MTFKTVPVHLEIGSLLLKPNTICFFLNQDTRCKQFPELIQTLKWIFNDLTCPSKLSAKPKLIR